MCSKKSQVGKVCERAAEPGEERHQWPIPMSKRLEQAATVRGCHGRIF